MKYDVSVVIPAYNAEHYLVKVVNSIIKAIKQYQIEIVIIENGSTDCTWTIAQKLQQKYEFVHAIQSVKGVSHARNKGLEYLSGEYVCFVDADDEMTEESISEMLQTAREKTAELYIFGYWKNGKKVIPDISNQLSVENKKAALIKNPTRYMTVWGKLFSRDIIEKNKIEFNPELTLSEDSDFLIEYMRYCNDISFSDVCVYRYNIQGTSTTRGYTGDKKRGYLHAIQVTREKVLKQEMCVRQAFSCYVFIQMNLIMVKDVFCKGNEISFAKKCSELKETCMKPVFKEALAEISWKECIQPRFLPAALCKLHFWYLCGYLYWLRNVQNSHRSNM